MKHMIAKQANAPVAEAYNLKPGALRKSLGIKKGEKIHE